MLGLVGMAKGFLFNLKGGGICLPGFVLSKDYCRMTSVRMWRNGKTRIMTVGI